ncbi:MAG: hypothetical protein IT326_02170 [Anaerolineae bacterium]|nr:hypothetical protein [Anaerolineae bacterium]
MARSPVVIFGILLIALMMLPAGCAPASSQIPGEYPTPTTDTLEADLVRAELSPPPLPSVTPTATLPPEAATATAEADYINAVVAAMNQGSLVESQLRSGTIQWQEATATWDAIGTVFGPPELLDESLMATAFAIWDTDTHLAEATDMPELDMLDDLCSGGPAIPAAPAYIPGSGPHTVVIEFVPGSDLDRKNVWDDLLYVTHRDWRPILHGDLPELVICVDEDDITLEHCLYAPPGSSQATHVVVRQQRNVSVWVVSAADGREIDRMTLNGGIPDACGSRYAQFGASNYLYWERDTPQVTDFEPWLTSIIEP